MTFTGHSMFNLRGAYGRITPVDLRCKAFISTPSPYQSSVAMRRLLGRVSRNALRDTLIWFWRNKWRQEHFKQNSRGKYRHYDRDPGYKSFKKRRWGSITDHVSKRPVPRPSSKDVMTQRRPKVEAKQIGASGVFKGTAKMAPWPFASRADGKGVTPAMMAEELARWSDKDIDAVAKHYRDRFILHYDLELAKTPRLRKRYAGYRSSL